MVMKQMVTVEQVLAATTADVLAGTQLDQPGVPGVYTVWCVSDVIDTTVTIRLGGRLITDGAIVVQRAGVIIQENEDPFFQMLSRGAGRPVITITETTAMSMRVRVKFLPAMAT